MLQRGGHNIHFGGQALRLNLNLVNQNIQEGSFTFPNRLSGSNLTDYILGLGANFTETAGQYANDVGTLYGLFVQDNWRVNQKLTLNFGARWDPYWPYRELQNAVVCYQPGAHSQRYPNAPTGLIFGSDPGCPAGSGMYPNVLNVAPRVGFAYDLNHKTVLRGGAGIYYTDPQTTGWASITSAPPFSPSVSLQSTCFVDPYRCAGVTNPFPADWGLVVPGPNATFGVASNISQSHAAHERLPEIGTWNLTLERQIGADWLFSAAYTATLGWRLYSGQTGNLNVNPAIYIPGTSTTANTQARRINPALGTIYIYDEHTLNYNALQLNGKRRFSHGLSLWANYSWSHSRDNFPTAPGGSGFATDSFSRNFDWGNSLDNIPNVFHLSGVWEVPKMNLNGVASAVLNGWEMTPIVSWQNGFPFTIYSGVDNSFSGNAKDRADFIGTDLNQAVLGDRSHGLMTAEFFNISLFKANAIGTYGNSGKNIVQGPGLFVTNFGMLKNARVTERIAIQFRAEFFNVFNNVNFGLPGATVSTPSFGQITSASSPRIIQFGIKLAF